MLIYATYQYIPLTHFLHPHQAKWWMSYFFTLCTLVYSAHRDTQRYTHTTCTLEKFMQRPHILLWTCLKFLLSDNDLGTLIPLFLRILIHREINVPSSKKYIFTKLPCILLSWNLGEQSSTSRCTSPQPLGLCNNDVVLSALPLPLLSLLEASRTREVFEVAIMLSSIYTSITLPINSFR